MLKRAINCFKNQSYPNKQMVIVYEKSDMPTHEFFNRQEFRNNIKVIKIDSSTKLTLGELRNISVKEADGSYVCQWDDDDWYDVDRLTEQMNHILLHKKSGSILSLWIIFDAISQKAYLPKQYLWEGSILCKRELMLKKPYPSLEKGEDTSVMQYLHNCGELSIIDDKPHLYVYIFHGRNTWDYKHFKKIIDNSHEMPSSYSKDVLEVISCFDIT